MSVVPSDPWGARIAALPVRATEVRMRPAGTAPAFQIADGETLSNAGLAETRDLTRHA